MSDPLPKGNTASLTSAADAHSRAILLYVEGTTHGRKFMSAARAASLIKPVLVLQAGRSNAGARAATSHTGVLAGADAVYDAAFRRAGMLRVGTMAELFDAAETLAPTHKQVGERLAILTNGGGAGVLATGRARHTEQGAASPRSRARSRASRVCFSTATVICQSVRGLEGAEVSSHLTPRWREQDSNPRSPGKRPRQKKRHRPHPIREPGAGKAHARVGGLGRFQPFATVSGLRHGIRPRRRSGV